jgi:hypothetical protein
MEESLSNTLVLPSFAIASSVSSAKSAKIGTYFRKFSFSDIPAPKFELKMLFAENKSIEL